MSVSFQKMPKICTFVYIYKMCATRSKICDGTHICFKLDPTSRHNSMFLEFLRFSVTKCVECASFYIQIWYVFFFLFDTSFWKGIPVFFNVIPIFLNMIFEMWYLFFQNVNVLLFEILYIFFIKETVPLFKKPE